MKRFKLEDDLLHEDTSIFALVSELPAYRLCFQLNNDLKLQLRRSPEDKSYSHKNHIYHFTSFEYHNKQLDLFWWLVENKSFYSEAPEVFGSSMLLSRPLLTPFKVFDFFLCCEGEELLAFNQFLKTELKRLAYVRTFKQLDTSTIKNIEVLFIKE